jgi:hypothetical protein
VWSVVRDYIQSFSMRQGRCAAQLHDQRLEHVSLGDDHRALERAIGLEQSLGDPLRLGATETAQIGGRLADLAEEDAGLSEGTIEWRPLPRQLDRRGQPSKHKHQAA